MDDHHNDRNSHDSFYLRQNELAQKSITLRVLHNHLRVNKAMCDEKKVSLEKETKALDEIHSKVWDLQNKICNQVSDFSTKHDHNEIIRNYPDLSPELDVLCQCERKSDVSFEENVEIEKLALEIRSLESNLKSANCDSLEAELTAAEKELQACEEESPESESLKKQVAACEERISSLRLKLGVEYKRIENVPLECLNNNTASKTISSNLKRTSTFDEPTSLPAPQTNLEPSKNSCGSSGRAAGSDRGGFVTASSYSSATENLVSLPSTSAKKVATEALSNGKHSSIINPPKKQFVLKTKSNLTQRR